MTDHTPGPWTWGKPRGEDPIGAIFAADRTIVLNLGDGTDYYPTAGTMPKEANARLIAAAPELLEAIKLLLSSSHDYQTGIAEAEAAIAKAEGRDHG